MATRSTATKKPKPATKKQATTKAARTTPRRTNSTEKEKEKERAPAPAAAAGFGPPDWGNVPPPPIEVPSTGDAALDAALAQVAAGAVGGEPGEHARAAPDEVLIAMFRGNALLPGQPFHDQALVDALTPAQKGKRNKAYWAAESEKNVRERVFGWFCARLATTAAGRAHLLDVAAGAIPGVPVDQTARVRGLAAVALRDAAPDAALWRAIGERLDPAAWVGAVDQSSSTWLMHAYTIGAMGALVTDPAAAHTRWRPLLEPAAARRSPQAEVQAAAIVLGIREYIGEAGTGGTPKPVRDPAPVARFVPEVRALLEVAPLANFAMFALERLPHDPATCEAIVRRLGPIGPETFFGGHEIKLLARTTDPAHLPVLAAALGANWMTWQSVFAGLASIGDPRGIAVIEAWMASNDASDRRRSAADAIAAIRARGGDPTDAQRAEAVVLLEAADRKKRKKR